MLARIDRVNVGIDQLTAVIEQLLAPYGEQLAQVPAQPLKHRRGRQLGAVR